MAAALRQLHACGLIHKDIKPATVMTDWGTGRVWLRGFGIASRVLRERRVPEPPEFIAGTLAYMAPEQTGWMNRSIDARSDLYALGVVIYELVTGSLPFRRRQCDFRAPKPSQNLQHQARSVHDLGTCAGVLVRPRS